MKYLFLIAALFLVVELDQAVLPAFNEEEVLDTGIALSIKSSLWGGKSTVADLAERLGKLPLMLSPYHGALQSYLMLPFTFPRPTVFNIRLYEILVGLLVILVAFFVTKDFFDRKTAYIAVVLLALNFTFIELTKIGIPYGSVTQLILLLVLLCLITWYRGGRYFFFYSGCFLLGLGLATRAWFIWLILALAVEAVVFRRELGERLFPTGTGPGRMIPRLSAGALLFCLGSSFLLIFNASSNFGTIRFFSSQFVCTYDGRINNFNYFHNLICRIGQFTALLSGRLDFAYRYWRGYTPNYLYPLFFLLCLIGLAWFLLSSKVTKSFGRKALFFAVMFLSMVAFSPFTASTFRLNHLMIMYPLVQILIAVAITAFLSCVKGRVARCLCVMLCSAVVLSDIRLFLKMRDHLSRKGGIGIYSDSIYPLADFLKNEPSSRLRTFDARVSTVLSFLSGRKVENRRLPGEKREVKQHIPRLDCRDLGEEGAVYVNHAGVDRKRIEEFYSFARACGRKVVLEKQFNDREGSPAFVVHSVRAVDR